MKRLVLFLTISLIVKAGTNPTFDDFFLDKSMRIDYYQTGTATKSIISLDEVIEEPYWAGSLTQLIDTTNLGNHLVAIHDSASGRLIYSRGFSSIFQEWQTTREARREIFRTFSASVLIPYPQETIIMKLFSRDSLNEFKAEFSTTIDPHTRIIQREAPKYEYKAKSLIKNGDPHRKVDILILPEGYTKWELFKFRREIKHFTKVFFAAEPFRTYRDRFNIWYLNVPSEESGIDNPRQQQFVKSAFGLSYNTFDSDRYILAFDNKTIRDIAANAPYDQLYFLVNSSKYGGGGIFNLYSTCYSHAEDEKSAWWPDYVFVHEFGHAFAGLADEYYSSQVAYSDFYPPDIEPWEPNITVTTSREKLKWKELVEADTPIPTPWEKSLYDNIPRTQTAHKDSLLRKQQYWQKVGAFQGAGYASEGLYRPYLDCRMFSKSLTEFCPVCQAAIIRMIRFYSE